MKGKQPIKVLGISSQNYKIAFILEKEYLILIPFIKWEF
ncbi:hypothetical protein EMIT07CA2_50348 [Brevibacillus sp. IT-7CA2]